MSGKGLAGTLTDHEGIAISLRREQILPFCCADEAEGDSTTRASSRALSKARAGEESKSGQRAEDIRGLHGWSKAETPFTARHLMLPHGSFNS